MAKKKSDPTTAQLKVLDLRQKHAVATKAHTDKPTDATKKHLDTIATELSAARKVENRERFVRVIGGRIQKTIADIRNVANVNTASYQFDTADVSKVETALDTEVKKTVAKMNAALTKSGPTKSSVDFTF